MGLPQINYLAVLVSGFVIFILGGLWYSPVLFMKQWTALMGKSEAEFKASSFLPAPVLFGLAFVCGLTSAAALAVILNHFNNVTPLRGALVGLLCWIGFAGATSFANVLFAKKPFPLWLIDTGFNLVSFLLAGIILALWR